MRGRWVMGMFLAGQLAAGGPAAALVTVTYEKPGVQASSATFSSLGVETFEGIKTGSGKTFTTDFGTGGAIKGKYRNVRIDGANQYGSAGGTGQHAVTFSTTGYTLDLSSKLDGGVTYFGYWLSALDRNNEVTLRSGGKDIFVFTPQAVLNAIGSDKAYYGNPNAPFVGRNKGETYSFVNFFSETPFDQILFRQRTGSGGYESDNHSVGQWIEQSGGMVPEPTTWVMLISGFGLVGVALRRKRRLAAAGIAGG